MLEIDQTFMPEIHARTEQHPDGRMVWEVDMLDDTDRLCATSVVTIAVRPRRDPSG